MAENEETEPPRVLIPGKPAFDRCDNKVVSARYTAWNFLPVAIGEQFRRLANVYFLVVGIIMLIGWYSPLYDSAISPWSTLGPLTIVIMVSLLVEGSSDLRRHKSDHVTNSNPCVVLNRAENLKEDDERDETVENGEDILVSLDQNKNTTAKIAFQKVKRMDIRQGMLVFIRNREMIPADLVLVASSNDNGSVYIETSSIDGETNLKLRTSPSLHSPTLETVNENVVADFAKYETIPEATARLARVSALGYPEGTSSFDHPGYKGGSTRPQSNSGNYVAALESEPPNPSVHTFTGKLTMPPQEPSETPNDVPLDADNVLLRGAVLRNTEWAIGLAFFTGKDTKLIRNSFETPSKFSILDRLMNKMVIAILCFMVVIMTYLAARAVSATTGRFDELFYVGFNEDEGEVWPYLPGLESPDWDTSSQNFVQFFLLYITLVSNFIPLSLYVTVEFVTFIMLWLLYSDLDMYDDTTNTRAVARRTTITDLGRIQYIFSDKTGTLTQNVMRFKRCSVDGMAFGAPIQKMSPGAKNEDEDSPFLPLRQLLVGRLKSPMAVGLEDFGSSPTMADPGASNHKLTFNAEMFLRVLCLCHTVVVEKDLDKKSGVEESRQKIGKSPDGAPLGFAYQAESPDEGALVSAASNTYGFQVVSRDSSGIRLKVAATSVLEDMVVVDAIKTGEMSLKSLAAESASVLDMESNEPTKDLHSSVKAYFDRNGRDETWTILAVNKFDSDRKRMSILLRSPPELGSLPILFCKGADSAMLDPEVTSSVALLSEEDNPSPPKVDRNEADVDDWEVATILGIQAHLGDFAREGLRTLVLGMRILTEEECTEWLAQYKSASVALNGRSELLTAAAYAVERDLHIVGATAIEDKLQKNVPQTIDTLAKAGIKLWVLTGDKRETAVEIGYSTCVLTPNMHLTQVPDRGEAHVRTQMCMEFLRLVKLGNLPEYQKAQLESTEQFSMKKRLKTYRFRFGKFWRGLLRTFSRIIANLFSVLQMSEKARLRLESIEASEQAESQIIEEKVRRGKIRAHADSVIQKWLASDAGKAEKRRQERKSSRKLQDGEISLASEETPMIFSRAGSARQLLTTLKSTGRLAETELRELSLAELTAQESGEPDEEPVVDEDTLSLESFFPGNKHDLGNKFDKRKRTLLERCFAIDKQVRKGQLKKHMHVDRLAAIKEEEADDNVRQALAVQTSFKVSESSGTRALVIEGAALKWLLGDYEMEQILFAVASQCDAVIACRVSPQQKALLVNLVRSNVSPEPITLAIGDGANDVGMIQEAHVGIGISGKEGQQAVNASDFAIAQFRFLETLILIHGRWNFFRLSTVVQFSFYKNAAMAGILITYTSRTIYSGTPLFDEWIATTLNFVAAWPIIFLGFFDRCLSKEYVRNHPEVYKATRENELINVRTMARWIIMVLVHVFCLFYLTIPQQASGGGMTSAFRGLMSNKSDDRPGDGEGGDLLSVGLVIYTSLIILLAYKVLLESRSLVHGRWPAFTCRKGGEGFPSRLAYTWIGVTYLSIFFFLFGTSMYQLAGRNGASAFSDFVDTFNHVFGTRSMSYMLMLFVPITGIAFDLIFKVYSNLFYPTQTQIHLEIEAKTKMDARRKHFGRSKPVVESV